MILIFIVWTRELKMRLNSCSIQGVVLCGKQSEDSWQKEGGLSRRFREEPCWQWATKLWQLHESPGEKLWTKLRKLHEGSGKESCWQCTTQSHESCKKDWETSRDDSAARSHESYLKDAEKSSAQNRESYMNDPEKSRVDSTAQSREIYDKDLDKSHWNETGLAIAILQK